MVPIASLAYFSPLLRAFPHTWRPKLPALLALHSQYRPHSRRAAHLLPLLHLPPLPPPTRPKTSSSSPSNSSKVKPPVLALALVPVLVLVPELPPQDSTSAHCRPTRRSRNSVNLCSKTQRLCSR